MRDYTAPEAFRAALLTQLRDVSPFLFPELRKHSPDLFGLQLDDAILPAAEWHFARLLELVEGAGLSRSIEPTKTAANDLAFQQFLEVQGLKPV